MLLSCPNPDRSPPLTVTTSVVHEGSKYSYKYCHTQSHSTQQYDVMLARVYALYDRLHRAAGAGARTCSARGETQLNHLISNPSGAHVDTAMIHKVCANVSYSEQEADDDESDDA